MVSCLVKHLHLLAQGITILFQFKFIYYLRKKVTQEQLTNHFYGIGSLPIESLTPRENKFITQQAASGKFHDKVILKQR
jgi:hypothetical protein